MTLKKLKFLTEQKNEVLYFAFLAEIYYPPISICIIPNLTKNIYYGSIEEFQDVSYS